MGFILSKFRKSKPSTKDALDKIDQDLRKLSRFQYDTELQQKRIIGRLVVGGIFLYLVFLVLAYFFGPRDLSWQQTLGWVIPFILFPFLIIMVKRVLSWWFNRRIVKNKDKYEALKKEKQRLLDDVMENETFKVAKEILEKYAPNHLLPKYLAEQQKASPMSLTPVPRTAQLRRRTTPLSSTPIPVPYSGNMGGFTPRAIRPYGPGGPGVPGQFLRQPINNFNRPALMPGPSSSPITPGSSQGAMIRGPPPPRFMLPPPPENPQYRTRKTGWLDKLVDYVVGDGPANRFALICRYCATHNGLATPEDFPYIGYRCVHCRQFNPPRQVRPSAPTLPKNTVLIEEMDSGTKSADTTTNDETETDKLEDKEESESKTEQFGDNLESSNSKEAESEDRENNEPLIELAASSTEDLTRSVESLLADGANTDAENNEQEEFIDDDSLKDDLTETILSEADKTKEFLDNEKVENAEDSKESQDNSSSNRNSL